MNTLRQLWIAYQLRNAEMSAEIEERAAKQAEQNTKYFRRRAIELELELIHARNATRRKMST
jgi:hypothetical protein